MNRRIGDRRIANGLGIVIMTMAVSTVGFILAGSTDPHTELSPNYLGHYFTPERPYPWPAVAMSGLSVLAEGVVLWLLLAQANASMILRSFVGCVAAGVPAVAIRAAELDRSRGYVTYHLLWLLCATVLMLSLLIVALTHATFRRFTSAAPANMALNPTGGRGRPPAG